MKITTRLSLAFFSMVAFTTIVGILGLSRMRDLDHTIDVITNERFSKLEMARRGLELIEENARLATLIFASDAADVERALAEQNSRSAEITALYADFEARINTTEERTKFENVKARRATYVSHRAALEQKLGVDRVGSIRLFQSEVLPELLAYVHAWDELVAFEGERVKDAVDIAEREYASARAVTILLIGVACLLGALVAVFVVRRIARPLRQVARAAELLEKDGITAPLPVNSTDEIGTLARAFNMMSDAVTFRQEQLRREMDIAQRIQTALLPKQLAVRGLEVAAAMRPAAQVGGDYYDVIPVDDGCWFGIGDVAGHGLESGLIMLMIQSSIMTLVRRDPDGSPKAVVTATNRALYENLSDRLLVKSFATLAVFRYRVDGTFRFAGAHEEIIVWRAKTERCEVVQTPGTWIGAKRDIANATVESSLALDDGDLMVLFTDGMIEARNREGVLFDVDRMCKLVEAHARRPATEIVDEVVAAVMAWTHTLNDDASMIVIRRKSPGG